MHTWRFTVSLVAALVLASAAHAQVYKTVDKHGNIIFSDKQSSGAKAVTVGPVQTYSAPTKPAPPGATGAKAGFGDTNPAKPGGKPKKPNIPKRYQVVITSPAHDVVVRQNAGNLTVQLSVKPKLHATDRIQFLLNRKPVGSASSTTSTVIPFVDRGTHTIGAKVLGARGQSKGRASSVTVHMKRFSANN